MTERERLIWIIQNALNAYSDNMGIEKEEFVADFLLKNGVRCMPFIAMIEQTTENGKFCKKQSEQKFNGRYCVVYEDESKWGTPLVDICGTKTYNTEEAEKALEERENND